MSLVVRVIIGVLLGVGMIAWGLAAHLSVMIGIGVAVAVVTLLRGFVKRRQLDRG